MELEIRGINLEVTDGIRGRIERRFKSITARFSQRISDITIRVEDVNGPRGGADKMCKIQAHIQPTIPIIIEEHDADLYVAIDRASSRFKQVLGRLANKLPRAHARRTHGKPFAAGDMLTA